MNLLAFLPSPEPMGIKEGEQKLIVMTIVKK